MELKCAVVFTLVSLLSVKASPHGYGVKGGAAARAEAGAAAGAFGGVGLPLSIASGPGFSGSFSKSSSSSFASSSASSSSFSFSGSGSAGFGLNSLGTPGSGGCAGGCQGSQSISNGNNDSHESGPAGNSLGTFSGAKAQAVAGAYAGSLGDSKTRAHGPCTNGVCSEPKSPCVGSNCKDTNESCKSGQCGSKPSSKTTLPDHDNEDCASGQCGVNSESASNVSNSYNCKKGNCNGNDKDTSKASSNDKNCALGQCGSEVPSKPAIDNFPSTNKCTSGNCAGGIPANTPGKHSESNDIPISASGSSTFSHDSDHHLYNSVTASTTTSQSVATNCKYGNCTSPSPNTKPYGYPGSNTYNPKQSQSAASGAIPSYNKPTIYLTAPKQEAPCTHPNCHTPKPEDSTLTSLNQTPGKTDCTGEYCDNGPTNIYPSLNNGYSQPQNTHFPSGSPSSQCNSPNCYPSEDESKPGNPVQYPSSQKGQDYSSSNCASGNCGYTHDSSPSKPIIPVNIQGQSQITPANCPSGSCGNSPSYTPNHDIQVSKVPIHSQGSQMNTPNCASGNCEKSPVQPVGTGPFKPIKPNHPPPLNCAFGPCDHTDFSYPRLPSYPQSIHPRPLNSASGNYPNYPPITPGASPLGSKFPVSSGQPWTIGITDCASGSCGNKPSPSSNCASGNCPNYPNLQSITGPIGSRFPLSPIQSSIGSPPNCASGNCGSSSTYQHGSFGSSHLQNPFYSNSNSALSEQSSPDYTEPKFPLAPKPLESSSPGCTSGNCGRSPTYHHATFGSSASENPTYSGANPVTSPQPGLLGSKYPVSNEQPSVSSSSACASGNCGSSPIDQQGTLGSSELQRPTYLGVNLAASSQTSPGLAGPKFSVPHGQPPVSSSPSCTSGNCGPGFEHGKFSSSSFQNPSTSSINPTKDCALGRCPNFSSTLPSAGPTGSQFPITSGQPSVSGPPGCTSGTCGNSPAYQHGSIGFSGFQSPSQSGNNPANTCASGNCASYPIQSDVKTTGSKFPSHAGPYEKIPFGSPVASVADNCASGNCPSHPSTSSALNLSDKLPDYVALGIAGGATKPIGSTFEGTKPSSTAPSQYGSGSLISSSFGASEAHSQSSVFNSLNKDKEQVYIGGFGGPPGILKPYEFIVPSPNIASASKHKEPNCSTGKCDTQSRDDISSDKHDTAHGLSPCSSGNCGSLSGKPQHGQSNVVSGAFAGAAATAESDAAVYTGGFGGPPGLLKPYDGGIVIGTSAAISGTKPTTALGGHDAGNKNNAYGVLSGTAAIANAGAFGSGTYNGGHNKAGGCDSECANSGHGSSSGDFGVARGISKSSLLEKLHSGAQSVPSAISEAGASSFAVGGNFASSSASAHSAAGSATKGGYGR